MSCTFSDFSHLIIVLSLIVLLARNHRRNGKRSSNDFPPL